MRLQHNSNGIIRRLATGILYLLLCATVCSNAAEADQQRLKVVATFSILGDLTSAIGGEHIELRVLVGPDSDAHLYQPPPADSRLLHDADVIVMNGLGFEGWMTRLVTASGTRAMLVIASTGIEPLFLEGDGGIEPDPHAWHEVANVRRYLDNIATALMTADPRHAEEFAARHASMAAQLAVLENEILTTVARLPATQRTIVTNHDAFGYFARAYGLHFIAPLGMSTESDASAAAVAGLIRQIREQEVRAVFLENISDPRLMQQIAREGGARIGGTLYSDALSAADGPAATWLDMMRHNLLTLMEALAR